MLRLPESHDLRIMLYSALLTGCTPPHVYILEEVLSSHQNWGVAERSQVPPLRHTTSSSLTSPTRLGNVLQEHLYQQSPGPRPGLYTLWVWTNIYHTIPPLCCQIEWSFYLTDPLCSACSPLPLAPTPGNHYFLHRLKALIFTGTQIWNHTVYAPRLASFT